MISSFIKESTQSSIIQIWVKIKGLHQNKSCTCGRIQMLIKRETDQWTLTSYRDVGRNTLEFRRVRTSPLHVMLFQVAAAYTALAAFFFIRLH